jgi:hypothetical protein
MQLLSFETSVSVYQSTWCNMQDTTVFCSTAVRTSNGPDSFLFPTLEYTCMANRNIIVAICITCCHPSLLFILDFPVEHFKETEQQHTHYLRTAVVRHFKVSELVKVNLRLHTMKAYRGVEAQFHSFLPSALHGGWWSSSCSCRFTPTKKSLYPVNRSLGGPQSRSGRFGEDENSAA